MLLLMKSVRKRRARPSEMLQDGLRYCGRALLCSRSASVNFVWHEFFYLFGGCAIAASDKCVGAGNFDWAGKIIQGTDEPLVSLDLWNDQPTVWDHRLPMYGEQTDRDFLFAELLNCWDCGCALVGELKKGKYICYQCSGWKGKRDEPYVCQEALLGEFSLLLRTRALDYEVAYWVVTAIKDSHADERRLQDEAVSRLQDELRERVGGTGARGREWEEET